MHIKIFENCQTGHFYNFQLNFRSNSCVLMIISDLVDQIIPIQNNMYVEALFEGTSHRDRSTSGNKKPI